MHNSYKYGGTVPELHIKGAIVNEAGLHGVAVLDRGMPQRPNASVYDHIVAY